MKEKRNTAMKLKVLMSLVQYKLIKNGAEEPQPLNFDLSEKFKAAIVIKFWRKLIFYRK